MKVWASLFALLPGLAFAQPNSGGFGPGPLAPALTVYGGTIPAAPAAATSGVPAALRIPLASDDTTAGYSVGNQWMAPNGQLWTAKQVAAGYGVWEPTSYVSRPGDVVASPLAVYGTRLLVSAYAGNAVQLTRASDSTTKNIAFLAGGALDVATGDAFCANTTCQMTTLYDQSGNGYNCTASTTNAPLWSSTNTVGNSRAIVFNSNPHAITNLPQTEIYCTISSSMSWSPSASSTFIVGQHQNGFELRTLLLTNDGTRGWLNSYNASGVAAIGYGTNTTTYTEQQPSVLAVTANTSNFNAYSDNVANSQVYASNSTFTGAIIAGNSTSWPGTMDMVGFAIWGSTLTATQVAAVQASFYQQFAIPPQYNDKLVIIGDSMSSGEGSSFDNSWSRLTLPLLSRPVRMYNHAVFGQQLTGGGGMLADFSGAVAGMYQTTDRNFIVTILAGTNDIRSAVSLSTLEAGMQTFVQDVHALGGNAKVLVATTPLQCDIYTGGGSTLTEFENYMAWLRTQWNVPISQGGVGADGLIDFASDPTIGISNTYTSSAFCSNTTISPDGVHPTDYAMGFYAPVAAAAINGVIH